MGHALSRNIIYNIHNKKYKKYIFGAKWVGPRAYPLATLLILILIITNLQINLSNI